MWCILFYFETWSLKRLKAILVTSFGLGYRSASVVLDFLDRLWIWASFTHRETLWNSLTFPWQHAAHMPMLSATHSMPVRPCSTSFNVNDQTIKFRIIYILRRMKSLCSYASNTNTCSTNWMLLNTHMNANIHLLMNSFGNFSLTRFFPWHFSDC